MTNTPKKQSYLSPRAKSFLKGTSPQVAPFLLLSPTPQALNPDRENLKLSPLSKEAVGYDTESPKDKGMHYIRPPIDPMARNEAHSCEHTSKKENFLIRISQLYQLYGSPAHYIEESTRRASDGLGMNLNMKSLPSFLIATFHTHGKNETVLQTTHNGNHLKKLELIDIVARRCAAGQYLGDNLNEGIEELDRIMMAPDPWSLPVLLIMYAISHGLSSVCLFEGGWRDAVVSSILGALTGLFQLRVEGLVSPKLSRLNGFFSCLFNSFAIRMLEIYVSPEICFYPSVISSISGILPGLGITIGAIEISQSQIVSGTSRMMDSFFKTILMAIGISVGSQTAIRCSKKTQLHSVCKRMELNRWYSALSLPFLSISRAFLLHSSSSQFMSQFITAAFGFFVYTVCLNVNFTMEMTVTLSAFAIAIIGHLFTLYNRRPSLVPILSGLLLLVPGGMSVRGATLSLLEQDDSSQAGSIAVSVITVAISISIGVFIANVLIFPGRNPKLEPLGM